MLVEKVTPYYRSLINEGDRNDPLAAMVLFSERERDVRPEESPDPIGDVACQACANGRLIHRYPDRALLLVTNRCPAHCRFCFRRERLDTSAPDIDDQELNDVVEYVGQHKEIREVILSGGDPLSLPDGRLLGIIYKLRNAGVVSIRLHTRYPAYDPDRCRTIGRVAERLDAIVVHIAHQREITTEFRGAIARLRAARFLLNQCVLLKGVNDSVEELAALSLSLVDIGILPYYLHYPDLAPGISHFRVPINEAIRLVRALHGKLAGYAIPRLVLDIPGGKGKILLPLTGVEHTESGTLLLTSSLTGEIVEYRESL
jgi:lysine 2,3-aminomutase